MLDINAIQDIESTEIEIVHPKTKVSVGASITLAGPEHPARKKISFDRQRRIRADMSKHGRIKFSDPEADAEDEIHELAACTLGWKGIGENGKELPFSREAAERIYTACAWLREQVSAGLSDRENFIQDSGAG